MEKQKRSYSREFKIKAVELSHHRKNVQSVAKELDISVKNLSRWRQEYKLGQFSDGYTSAVSKSKESIENAALRKALRDAELERDILKRRLASSPRAAGKI